MFCPRNAFRSTKRFLKSRYVENALRKFESSDSTTKRVYSPLFFNEEVQKLLRKMTHIKPEIVFRPKPTGSPLKSPRYKLMTTEELQEVTKKMHRKTNYLLQIPPLIDVREVEPLVLDADTSLDGFDDDHSKHVFIDTSNDLNFEERVVVVREPNGVLRTASHSERMRVIQIYCPMPGRDITVPQMFLEENLKQILDREEYEFILDKACAQFEPYDKLYHQTIELTYETINKRNHFERLHSTRHFGSLAFYLVTHKKIDNLLLDNLTKGRIRDACNLVRVYHLIHPKCQSAEASEGKEEREALRSYIELESKSKDVLTLHLNKAEMEEREKEAEKEEFESGVKSVHGL